MSDHDDLKLYITAEFTRLHQRFDRMDRIIDGNGQPGLVKTVAQHGVWIKILSGIFTAATTAAATARLMGAL